MEKLTKEWSEEFLVPVTDAELSNTDTTGSPMVTRVEHVRQSSGTKKNKNQEEVHDIETDEEDNAWRKWIWLARRRRRRSRWTRKGDEKGGGEANC